MFHRHVITLALATLLAAGCASQATEEQHPLPFHVAVIPLEPVASDALTPTDMDGEPLPDVKLSFDPARTTKTLVAQLDGKSFTRATELGYPDDRTREEFLALPAGEQEDYWVAAAEDAGADLVLLTEFQFAPTIWSNTNNSFWLNLPLFLLGGPFCYFVDDRDYHSNVALEAQFFDVTPLRLKEASFSRKRKAQIMLLDKRVKRSDLDFWDRASGNVGHFALSLIVPAGLLATQSDGVRETLEEEIVAELAGELVDEVRLRSDLVSRGQALYDFWVDPASVQVVQAAAGSELRGRLVLELGGNAERMDSFAYRLGPNEAPTTVPFDEGTRKESLGGATRDYEFKVPLGAGTLPSEVRLEFEDASASARRRYTFAPRSYTSGT
jgi:hypothetical protein